jgi:hypothetical protein
MKMTKKSGVYIALTAVVLVAALLITSCLDVLDPSKLGIPEKKEAPEGKRYVRLSLGSAERTLMPGVTLANFTAFEVTIGTVYEDALFSSAGDLEDEDFALAPSTYIFTVKAFLTHNGTPGDPTNIVAAQYSDSHAVTATGTIPITLVPIKTGTGTGSFGWNLTYAGANTFNTTLDTATIALHPLTDTTFASPVFTAINLTNTNANSTTTGLQTVTTGFYRARIVLALGGYQTASITEIVHIYQGQTTLWGTAGIAVNFPALTANTYLVTFNFNNDTTTPYVDTSTLTNAAHNSLITGTPLTWSGASYPVTVTPPSTGALITGWFRDAAGTVTETATTGEWVFGSSRVYGPTTLYAKWAASSVDINLTSVSYESGSDFASSLTATTATVSQGALRVGQTVNFTIPLTGLPTGTVAANTTWSLQNGGSVQPSTTDITNVIMTLDASMLPYLLSGTNTITVTIFVGTEPYSKNFTFTVNP